MSAAQQTKLATMARGIADFFRAYPPEQAATSVAEHINKFWTRRMRDDLRALVERDPAAVDPLVLAAAGRIRPGQAAPSA